MQTLQEKQNKIRQACIKADPTILDLKFGCFVRDKYGVARLEKDGWKQWGNPELNMYENKNKKGNTVVTEILEIIGREITLADVLYVIKKNIETDEISHSDGYEYIVKLTYRDEVDSWKLPLNLNDQSEETLDFIINLID